MAQAWVYFMTNKANGTLYCGVTKDLGARVLAHREGRGSSFCRRYGLKRLVHYEHFELVAAAIQRETNIKRWPRAWKVALIEGANPGWDDLYLTLNF
jgi:putative endonuclease